MAAPRPQLRRSRRLPLTRLPQLRQALLPHLRKAAALLPRLRQRPSGSALIPLWTPAPLLLQLEQLEQLGKPARLPQLHLQPQLMVQEREQTMPHPARELLQKQLARAMPARLLAAQRAPPQRHLAVVPRSASEMSWTSCCPPLQLLQPCLLEALVQGREPRLRRRVHQEQEQAQVEGLAQLPLVAAAVALHRQRDQA